MKAKATALMHKRAALIAQIGAERTALAQQGAALRPAALMIDKLIPAYCCYPSPSWRCGVHGVCWLSR
jgi:hypothetical protein